MTFRYLLKVGAYGSDPAMYYIRKSTYAVKETRKIILGPPKFVVRGVFKFSDVNLDRTRYTFLFASADLSE